MQQLANGRIEVDTRLHPKTIMKMHNLGRTAAYEAKKRGWTAGPQVKNVDLCAKPEQFDHVGAYRIAKMVFHRKFAWTVKNPRAIHDDCLQEAVLRMLEMAGTKNFEKDGGFFYRVGYFAIRNYMTKIGATGLNATRFCSWDVFAEAEKRLSA